MLDLYFFFSIWLRQVNLLSCLYSYFTDISAEKPFVCRWSTVLILKVLQTVLELQPKHCDVSDPSCLNLLCCFGRIFSAADSMWERCWSLRPVFWAQRLISSFLFFPHWMSQKKQNLFKLLVTSSLQWMINCCWLLDRRCQTINSGRENAMIYIQHL